MKKVLIGILIPFLMISLFTPVVVAHGIQAEVDQSQIDFAFVRLSPIRYLPNHPLYPLISAKEKIQHVFKSDQIKKANFDMLLSEKRIKEAYLLNQNRKYDKAEQQLENYTKTLDKFQTTAQKAKDLNMNMRNLSLKSVESLSYQRPMILSLEDYPQAQDAHKKFEEVVEFLKKESPEIEDLIKTRIPSE
ncbi:MAG TPA: DUF5667 domain-containing protein [Patescibacteria group bacterium]